MENASKALLMAGGILIALMIAAVVALMFSRMSGYWAGEDSIAQTKRVAEFNNQYEPYMKNGLTLLELKSVYNKIESNNNQNPEYLIDSNLLENKGHIFPITLSTGGDPLEWDDFIKNRDSFSDLKYDNFKKKSSLTFNCDTDNVEYSSEGRINKIDFTIGKH